MVFGREVELEGRQLHKLGHGGDDAYARVQGRVHASVAPASLAALGTGQNR